MAELKMSVLKEAVKAVNETDSIEPNIKIVGVTYDNLVDSFTAAVEVLENEEVDIPDVAILAYNAIYEEESPEPKEEPEKEKKAAVKKKATLKKKDAPKKKATTGKTSLKKKQEKKPAVKKSTAKKDDYGYTIGSQGNLFCKAIKRKAMSMAEVKDLDWNERNATFYDVFNRLAEKGLAGKDEKSGKMKMKK